MAHFAKLDENNTVVFVTVGRDEDENREDELSAQTGDTYKRTSYNTMAGVHTRGGVPFRGNYAGIGFTYDEGLDAFIPPKPSEDATLDEETYSWIVPEPDEA
jgi:hypothetical protein